MANLSGFLYRSSVIRSLFYSYKPFVDRPFETDPHVLAGGVCMEFWHRKSTSGISSHWSYFIKFQKRHRMALGKKRLWERVESSRKSVMQVADSWEAFSGGDENSAKDLLWNPDDGCSTLHIQSSSFSKLPSSMVGLRLAEVCLTMSGAGFRYQRLALRLVPSHLGTASSSSDGLVTAIINDIVAMRVYEWFRPQYEVAASNPCNERNEDRYFGQD